MNYIKIFLFILFTISLITTSYGQDLNIKGSVIDKIEKLPLVGATVLLINKSDTTQIKGTTANDNGVFNFINLVKSTYILRVEYAAYKTYNQDLLLTENTYNVGVISMVPSTLILETAIIKGRQELVKQKGDTTEYSAGAYKTNPDAYAQDLISKMPGVTNENGTLKAQGEIINKVTVDGKEFFGEDASIALKNLPAEIVDKIQVFDKPSDQSQFTGFDDGNSSRTINIITKGGKTNGTFGRIFGGYGTDNRYTVGLSLNSFKGDRRITVLGLANNINQQNFAAQDLSGINASGGGGRGGMGGGQRGGPPGMGGSNNFNVGQQGGISTTQSIGLNYTNSWGKKIKVTGSYFLNRSENLNTNIRKRNYLLTDAEQVYNESTIANTDNLNHRFNARLEYNIDTSNSILLTPRLTIQNTGSNNLLRGKNTFSDSVLISRTNINISNATVAYNFNNSILYRHKFLKPGRTLSIDITNALNDRNGNSGMQSSNRFYSPRDSISSTNQVTQIITTGNNFGGNMNYTEPFGKKSIVQFNFNTSFAYNFSNRNTNAFDISSNEYTSLVPWLSSQLNNDVQTQRGGASYRFKGENFNLMAGLNYQNLNLMGKQNFPFKYNITKNFNSFLPNAMLNYKLSKTKNLRIYYRTSTNTPSVNQLQNVIDNTNPLQLTTGNPNLNQEYNQYLNIRYSSTRPSAGSSFMTYFNGNVINSFITNSITLANENTIVGDSILLNRGSQITRPVNLNSFINLIGFTSYGIPIQKIKTNINLNLGFGFTQTPGQLNAIFNKSYNYNTNAGFSFASNISEKVDFNFSYTGNYNIVAYNIQPQNNYNYFFHVASLKFNVMPWKSLVLYSDITNTLYNGLGAPFDRSFFLWNPAIGYKFLKNNAAEIRVSCFDILKQNNSISRTIQANYIEDNRTTVLTRFLMFAFTYTFRNFKTQKKTE